MAEKTMIIIDIIKWRIVWGFPAHIKPSYPNNYLPQADEEEGRFKQGLEED